MLVMNKTGLFGSEKARVKINRYGFSKGKQSIGVHWRKSSAYFYVGNIAKSFGDSVLNVKRLRKAG